MTNRLLPTETLLLPSLKRITGRLCDSIFFSNQYVRPPFLRAMYRKPSLMVTHDPRILDLADRLLAMEDGRLVENSVASMPAG